MPHDEALAALERLANLIEVQHLEHAEAVERDLNLVADALRGTDA